MEMCSKCKKTQQILDLVRKKENIYRIFYYLCNNVNIFNAIYTL